MERTNQTFFEQRTSRKVLLHQDDIAALIQEIGEHYELRAIEIAGWKLLAVEEFPNLIVELKQDQRPLQVQNLSMAFQHKDHQSSIQLQIDAKGVRFQASRNTPFEAGVWLRIETWIKRRAPGKRLEVWNAIGMIGSVLLLFPILHITKQPESSIYLAIGLAVVSFGLVFLVIAVNKLSDRTQIFLIRREDRKSRLSRENWIALACVALGAILKTGFDLLLKVFAP